MCLIISILEGRLGMLREVVWEVCLCIAYVGLRITFSEKNTCYKVLKGKGKYFRVTVKQFTIK